MYSFNELKLNLKKDFTGLKKIKLAILSDSASQLLHTAIRGYGYEVQVNFDVFEADYNQIDLQIFDLNSELYEHKPDFIFINRCSEKLLKEFYKKDKQAQSHFAENIVEQTRNYYSTITSKLPSKVIINTYPEINDSVFGNYAAKNNISFIYQLRKANMLLMDLSRECSNMLVCDLTSLSSWLGYQNVFDPKMYVNADMVYNIDFLPYIAKNLTDVILSVNGTFKKCLILDLDNTTWGGIIGDDGLEGIQVGDLGVGKVFTELQLWAKQLRQRGIILTVCSKNTEDIAKEPFISHPDMVLKLDDLAMFVANWDTKVENIRYIQSVLNIGFDSMVFIDDNPFEREMVKSAIPDITVPDMPEDPVDYLSYLRSLNLFETASFTEEDEERTKQYQEEAKRNIFQQRFENEGEFLESLEMKSEVRPFSAFTIPRIAQLTQRSNQFNLRTVRYTEENVKQITLSQDYFTISFTLADRFGENGLICLIILKKEDKTLFIDSWIMSCRVLKRGMEIFTLNTIVELARNNNFAQIIGEYIPTKKNGIVKNHYRDLGFTQHGDLWALEVDTYNFEERKNFIHKI